MFECLVLVGVCVRTAILMCCPAPTRTLNCDPYAPQPAPIRRHHWRLRASDHFGQPEERRRIAFLALCSVRTSC